MDLDSEPLISASSEITPHHNGTSINSLPNEILAAIFEESMLLSDEQDQTAHLLLICCISKRLRNVAIHTPPLWRNVYIAYKRRRSELERANTWLERGKSCLVDITVDFRGRRRFATFEEAHSIAAVVLPYIDRWRRLILKSHAHSEFKGILISLRHVSAPSLEHVEILSHITELDRIGGPPIDDHILLGGTPSLKSAFLCQVPLGRTPPLTGLTSLALHMKRSIRITVQSLRDTLASALSLVTLSLGGDIDGMGAGVQPLDMPSLRSLSLTRSHRHASMYPACFMALLSTPSLESLKFNYILSSTLKEIIEQREYFGCSSQYPMLNTLQFRGCPLADIPEEFHSLCLTVRRICLIDTQGSSVIAPKFYFSGQGVDYPWPALETIICDPNELLPGIGWLCNVIRHREAIGLPLKSVQVPNRDLVDERGKWLEANVQVEQLHEVSHDPNDKDLDCFSEDEYF